MPIYWVKDWMTRVGNIKEYTFNVETGLMAFNPSRAASKWNVQMKNPRDRYNSFVIPPVFKKATHRDGKIVNPAQKPQALLKAMLDRHMSPGSTVLVLTAGAGGEILGALSHGCNVVACESDEVQYDYLVGMLTKMANDADVALAATRKKLVAAADEAKTDGEHVATLDAIDAFSRDDPQLGLTSEDLFCSKCFTNVHSSSNSLLRCEEKDCATTICQKCSVEKKWCSDACKNLDNM
jgi:hypothetical protein